MKVIGLYSLSGYKYKEELVLNDPCKTYARKHEKQLASTVTFERQEKYFWIYSTTPRI